MRYYAKIFPQFWIGNTGKQIKKLGRDAQVLALYLLTSPHATMLGVYYLPITLIVHETGIPLQEACKTLQSLCELDFCTYDDMMEYVWVHEMAFYQVGGQLKSGDNRVKNLNDTYQSLPELAFLKRFHEKYKSLFLLENARESRTPLQDPPKTLLSQELEQELDQEKEIFMSGKPDVVSLACENNFVNPDHASPSPQQPSTSLKTQALEVLQFLNEKTGRAYREVETNLKLIIARLKSGATVMDCRQVIAKKTREWKSDPKMSEYLRPATLFNATKFEQYFGELLPDDDDDEEEDIP